MVLDTGASMTIIPWDVAEALGYDPSRSPQRSRFMTGSGMEAAPLLTVHAIEVLGVRVARVPVLCHDLPQRSLVDGLLGLSFLRHCRLSVDFQRGLLELSASTRKRT
jgi:clan AA aspartic protease (TIGR02281 family)